MSREADDASAVRQAIKRRRDIVNEAAAEEIPVREPSRLYEAARHLLDAGGKRLRPVVVLLVGEMLTGEMIDDVSYREFPDLDGETVDLLATAVSVEVVHLFTLIHDDIMDEDDLRRGVPAVHEAFDMETAILAGDTLYSTAFEILLRADAPPERMVRALERLASTCTEICEGQALDVEFESGEAVSIDDYREMIELKTAVLYGASAAIPGIVLGASRSDVETLYEFGVDIGMGFQIQDDVLDLVSESETLGKQRGSDLVEDKETIITVHARNAGVDLDGLLPEQDVSDADIEAAVQRLADAGSIEFAQAAAEDLIEDGKAHLEAFPENDARKRLEGIADYFIQRSY